MTEEIDRILILLQDGEWHLLTEITQKIRLNQTKIQLITDFLTKYDFIKLNETEQKAKLTAPAQKFVKKLERTQ